MKGFYILVISIGNVSHLSFAFLTQVLNDFTTETNYNSAFPEGLCLTQVCLYSTAEKEDSRENHKIDELCEFSSD